MSQQQARRTAGPWVIDARSLGRRPGASRTYQHTAPIGTELGVPGVITIPEGAEVQLDLLAEAVMEGVLISGTAAAPYTGQCARCLDPIEGEIGAEVTELFAYPESTTEETTEADEVFHLVDDLADVEPIVRDALVLALPHAPVCDPDCAGLCVDCGRKWADLEPGHVHERIDPRWAALRERFGGPEQDQE